MHGYKKPRIDWSRKSPSVQTRVGLMPLRIGKAKGQGATGTTRGMIPNTTKMKMNAMKMKNLKATND